MIALTKAQVFIALALSLHSVRAFEPTFSAPRQCESLSISWSSVDLPTSIALTEITMSLIPLDSNPAHFPPEPYTLAVPVDGAAASAGSVSIASLPFPAGTDFFAQAYIPGMSGPTKRTVSGIMKVGHSAISDCLPVPEGLDKRKVKQFGKRQISVIGPNTVGTADLNATPPAATPSANTPINVIGVGQVPANGSPNPAAGSSSAPASASSGAPPIGVIGTQVIPATPIASSEAPPVNAVPPPSASSSGPVAPVNVIGTSFVDATPAPGSGSDSSVAPAPTDSASFVPNFTTDQAGQQDATTSCTSTWATETAQAETTTTDCTTTTWETAQAEATSTDCTTTTEAAEATATQDSSYDSSYGNSYDNSSADSETTTSCTDEVSPTEGSDSSLSSSDVPMPSPTQGYNGESNASSYGSFDDMVNAANEMFHAWNPYKPAYTPST